MPLFDPKATLQFLGCFCTDSATTQRPASSRTEAHIHDGPSAPASKIYKHNVNIAGVTGGQQALGVRYFEGAAGGAVMIGIPPDCEEYYDAFDWDDAVIPVPYSPADFETTLSELDSQPQRLARVSKNVVSCLLRHDWVYRWEQILNSVDIEPTPALAARKATLRKLAHSISLDTGVQAMDDTFST